MKEKIMKLNADIVREACHVIWTEGQIDRVPEFYSDDFTADYAFTDWGSGREGVKALAATVRVGLPDYREEIKLLIDGGEYIVVELLIEGTHRSDERHGADGESGCFSGRYDPKAARRQNN